MVMMPDVVYRAYKSVHTPQAKVIYMSPQGKTLSQSKVEELSKNEHFEKNLHVPYFNVIFKVDYVCFSVWTIDIY